MSELIKLKWLGEPGSGLPRRHRQPCEYAAYVPDHLSDRPILLDGDVAADVADAEMAITRLNAEGLALANTEALARLLLKAESVASSKIEGLEIGGRRLLHADMVRQLGEELRDITANEVLGNIDAMTWAVDSVTDTEDITVEYLLEIHRRLLTGTRLETHGGQIRTGQNWIGGSDYNPCSAVFVPPPPQLVPQLLHDLAEFCNQDSLPAVVQAAIAHAQFETIHPFVDGNGRTGRVLIQIILRKRGLATSIVAPVSLILATWSQDYVDALMRTRYVGSADSQEGHDGLNHWIALFAAACSRAVSDAYAFEDRVSRLQQGWRERLGTVRARSALDRLIATLPGVPVMTVNSAAQTIDRSFPATNDALDRLVEARILSQVNVGRRNRAFEAREIIDAFTELERQLASPTGNTRVSRPTRAVPPRPTTTRDRP